MDIRPFERAWLHSELVLVDADLAERARDELPVHPDSLERLASRTAERETSSPREPSSIAAGTEPDTADAVRRLTELAEAEPVTAVRRRTRIGSVAFAATAWALLAFLVVEMRPWQV